MVDKIPSVSFPSYDLYLLKKIFPVFLLTVGSSLFAQNVLTIEKTTVNNSETGTWSGVNIPRSGPTSFTYSNNSVTSVNSNGYMLQAGDENTNINNNNLDGMLITGNKFTWNGSDQASITHAVFTGYNINSRIIYNYLDLTPHGILFKSGTDEGSNMTYTSGGAAYNLIRNAKLSLRIKGMNGVHVYNNTFYNDESAEMAVSLIDIDANNDRTVPAPSLGTRIYNNIFYTRYQVPNIKVESWCLSDFESDYNVFYCETGTPLFDVSDVLKTFTEWQAMGFDQHSVVVNPDFVNTTDLVPASRLDYGTDLGNEWNNGLSTSANWSSPYPAIAPQNGTWQAGARIFASAQQVQSIKIYPNPAIDHLSVSIIEPTAAIDYIRIINLSSTVVFETNLGSSVTEFQIPIILSPGIYFVQLGLHNQPHYTEKLVVASYY
jgi:hypothetical protein